MALRIALEDFQLGNPLYAGATIDVWTVDANLAKTATRATLYQAPTGAATRTNPQILDSRGKWAAPVYVDRPVVLTVTPTTGTAHDTAVVGLVPRWRGVWQTATLYYPNERVRHPTTATTYVVLVAHTSGTFATDLGAARLEQEWDADTIADAVEDAHGDFLHGATFGLLGNGVADETTALQTFLDACAAQKRPGMLAPGTYLHAGLTLKSNTYLYGSGRENTWLKLKAGANVDSIRGENAQTLFGGGSYSGIRNFGLFDLGIDGNRANQSPANPDLCNGIAIYGAKGHLARLTLKDIDGNGMWTEWGQYGEPTGGMTSLYQDIEIDTCGRHGWKNYGPHDSTAIGVIVCDASQDTDNTYDGINQGPYGQARYLNCHAWHRAAAANRMRFAANSNGYSTWIGCHFEGGRAQFRAGDQGDTLIGCDFYGHFGGAGTAMVTLAANNTIIRGGRWNNSTSADCFALKVGDGSNIAGYEVDGLFFAFTTRTPFNFANDGGGNIRGLGATASGGATAFAGTINAASRVDYSQIGTVIEFRSDPLFGRYPSTRGVVGSGVWGSFANTTPGARQEQRFLLTADTSGTTGKYLTVDGGVGSVFTHALVPASGALAFTGDVIAYDLGNGDTKWWTVAGLIKRGSTVGSTALVGSPTVSSPHADSGASSWTLGVTADATFFGALLLTGTGATGRSIRWLANLRTTQVQV